MYRNQNQNPRERVGEEKWGGNKELRLKREMDDIDGPVPKELFLERERER